MNNRHRPSILLKLTALYPLHPPIPRRRRPRQRRPIIPIILPSPPRNRHGGQTHIHKKCQRDKNTNIRLRLAESRIQDRVRTPVGDALVDEGGGDLAEEPEADLDDPATEEDDGSGESDGGWKRAGGGEEELKEGLEQGEDGHCEGVEG